MTDLEQRGVNVIRALALDTVEKAKSGHQGTAMALAPLAHVLFSRVMNYDADSPEWFDRDRSAVVAQNRAFQAVDLSSLDNDQLASRLTELLAHFETQARRNLETHGGDLMPVGDFLAHCEVWGIDPGEAAALLRGSSPATVETAPSVSGPLCEGDDRARPRFSESLASELGSAPSDSATSASSISRAVT